MENQNVTLSDKSRLGLGIVAIAFTLGLGWDVLLRATPWGINVGLWMVLLLAGGIGLARWQRISVAGEGEGLLAPVLFFAVAFAWRDSATLHMLNGAAICGLLALAILHYRSGQLRVAEVTEYTAKVGYVWGQAFGGSATLLTSDIDWQEVPHTQWSGTARALGRGALFSLPLLWIFGSLLTSADAAFEQLTSSVVRWLFTDYLTHVFCIALVAWPVGGLLRQMVLAPEWVPPVRKTEEGWSLGIIELSVMLGLLNVLFLAFVCVQSRYFFGGLETVATSPGLTVAEYARRGFFELVTVAALVLPLLLFAHGVLRKEQPIHERIFCGLAGSLIALLFVIMVSAVQRMWLYQSLYGLTELRFYTTAFMGWLALVFAWFSVTVLRGQRERFAFGVLVSGIAAAALLNVMNPDAIIARTNVYREGAASSLDTHYVTSLSADAVPTLVAALPTLNAEKRQAVVDRLVVQWSPPSTFDWRTWNWSRSRAQADVVEYQAKRLGNAL